MTGYTWDTLDRMQKLTYPMRHGTSDVVRREMTLTYDIASRIDSLKYDDAQTGQMFASNPVYNAASQTESLTIGSPSVGSQLTESYTYDAKTGLLTTQKVTRNSDSATFLDLKYNYTLTNDANNNGAKTGQLTGITDNQNQMRNRAFEYDKLGRLKKVKGGTGAFYTPDWWQDYAYDRYGNRTSVTKTGGANIPLDGLASLGFNTASNRVNSANFEYDPAGNQTKAVINAGGTVQQYRYDAAGRLAQVLDGGGATLATYSYGASNQRLMSVEGGVTTYYGWDGGQVIAEYDASGASALVWRTSYVYLGGRLLATTNGGGTRFHHPDRLGTNIVTDQSNGEVVTVQMGLPFGTQQPAGPFGGDNSWQHATKNNPSKKRFTSYDRSDATGLDYAVNRFYQSAQGRFTQVDPIGMSAASLSDPQSLNLYSYCGNDPINHVDPDGLFFKKLFGWIGKAFKWIAIAVTVAIAILTVIPAAWAGVALGKMLVFLATHKTLAGIIGLGGLTETLGGRIGTPPTFPGTSSGGGVGGFLSRLQDSSKVKELGSRAWDWLLTDGLQHIANISSGFADTITFGGTKKIRQWMGTDDEVDHDSMMYKAGEVGGIAWGFAVGGATGVKGVAKRTVSEYVDVTVKGARVRNIATNVPKAEFEATLLQNGFTKTVVGGGKVSEFTKGALRYTTRGFSKSGPPTAEVFVNGVRTMKIRLQ